MPALACILMIASSGLADNRILAPLHWGGKIVAITPFDLKLMAAGFYAIHGQMPNAPQSVERIFERASAFDYKKDVAGDDWQGPDLTERTRRGDCEDMALWVYRELRRNGYARVRIMVGKFDAAEKSYHTWVTLPASSSDDLIVDPALQTRLWKRSQLLPSLYQPSYSYDGVNKYDHTAG